MIKNLTKAEYYRSRNLPIPRACNKLAPQPPVRTHLLEPIPSMTAQVKKYIQNKLNQNEADLDYIHYEKLIHELEDEIRGLKGGLLKKEDELSELTILRQKDSRKVEQLTQRVYDLQIDMSKKEYEHKATLEFMIKQHNAQKRQAQGKIITLEEQIKKIRKQYEKQISQLKAAFQNKLASNSGEKNTFRQASENVIDNLKKDIQSQINANKKLKHQLILSQKENLQRGKFLEEENYTLKNKLESQATLHSIQLVKIEAQLTSKTENISQLSDKIQELQNSLRQNRKQSLQEKEFLEKIKNQQNQEWKKLYDQLFESKKIVEEKFRKVKVELGQERQRKEKYQLEANETKGHLSLARLEKEQIISRYEKILVSKQQGLHQQHAQILERLNKEFNQREIQLNKKLGDISRQMKQLTQKLTQTQQREHQKNIQIQKLKQKLTQKTSEFYQLKEQKECREKQMKGLVAEICQIRQSFSAEIAYKVQQIQTAFTSEKSTYTTKISDLQKTLNKIEFQRTQEKLYYESIIDQKQRHCEELEDKLKQIQQQNVGLEKTMQEQSLKIQETIKESNTKEKYLNQKISDLDSSIRKNNKKIDNLLAQNAKLTTSNESLEKLLQKTQEELKKSRQQTDQIRLQSLRKCKQIEEHYYELKAEQEKQIKDKDTKINKYQGQIFHLNTKLENVLDSIKMLEQQKQVYLNQNERIKKTLMQRQHNKSQQEISHSFKQWTDKITSEYREKISELTSRNQTLLEEVGNAKQSSLEYVHKIQQFQQELREKNKIIEEKNTQNVYLQEKLEEIYRQKKKSQQKSTKLENKIINLEAQTKRYRIQNNRLQENISRYEEDFGEIKKSCITDTGKIEQMKTQISKLMLLNQQRRMQIDFQVQEKEKIKSYLDKAQKQLEETVKKLLQLQNNLRNERKKQEQETTYEIKYNQMKDFYEKKISQFVSNEEEMKLVLKEKNRSLLEARTILEDQNIIVSRYCDQLAKAKEKCQAMESLKLQNQELIQMLRKLETKIRDKNEQLQEMETKLKDNEKRQGQLMLQQRIQELENQIRILYQKVDFQKGKTIQIKGCYEKLQLIFKELQHNHENARQELSQLKAQIRRQELQKEKMLQKYNEEYKKIHEKAMIQRNEALNKNKQHFEEYIRKLRKQIQEEKDKKKQLITDLNIWKNRYEDFVSKVRIDNIELEQKIKHNKRTIEHLLPYKKKWEKITGNFKQCENEDIIDPLQIEKEVSLNSSIRYSIIVEDAGFPKLEKPDPEFSLTKNLNETPGTRPHESSNKGKTYRYKEYEQQVNEQRRISQFQGVQKEYFQTPSFQLSSTSSKRQ